MTGRRVGDLVTVRPVRTVIHLDDARDPQRRAEVATCFVPTPETLAVLRTVFGRMAAREGTGCFIQGPYGCGKSHLLTYLGLAAAEAEPRAVISSDPGLASTLERAAPGAWLVASLSLVDHPSREPLESLVAASIESAFEARAILAPPPPGADRRAWAEALGSVLTRSHLAGVLLLIDELSEFLRAKPDARSFAEDIRFLQFLGERAARIPLIVVAGLQEGVEETGPIAPEAMAKIKDRYPSRFTLTADHVGALVSGRILSQREGARAELDAIHRHLRACLPHWPVDADSFARLYPVHPATLAFLENLKPLFSQHRGVVDFLVTRLSGERPGDPGAGQAALLDQPAGTLLTADAILDHFRARLRERIETAPLVDEVLAWWDENLPSVYPETADRALGARAVKVLALASLFPYPRPITAREMAQILLVCATDLDPALNDHMVAQVLDAAASRGAYIERTQAQGGDVLAATYVLRRGADLTLQLRAQLREIAAGLAGRPEELVAALAQGFDAPHLPLTTLVNQGRSRRTVSWQSTPREGWVVAGDPAGIPAADRDAMAREVATTEVDFFLYVCPPRLGDAQAPAAGARPAGSAPLGSMASTGGLAGAPPAGAHAGIPAWSPERLPDELAALPLLVWRPRPIADVEFLAQARARQILARRLAAATEQRAVQMRQALEPSLEDDARHLGEMATRAYFEGSIVGVSGPIEGALAGGLPTFERLLERVVAGLLEQRYPRHFTVAPTGVALSRGRLAETIEGFLRPGALPVPGTATPAVRGILEGYLKGLGLAARAGAGWVLKVDLARSPVATQFLSLVGDAPTGTEELYWQLRKGPMGLSRQCFELVLCCLVFSGHLTALSQGRRLPLARLAAAALDRLGQVAREEPLDGQIFAALLALPFVSEKLRQQVPGPTLERQLFEEIVAQRSRGMLGTASLASRLAAARQTGLMDHLGLDRVAEVLESLGEVLAQVRAGEAPREGLTGLHAALEARGLSSRLAEVRPLLRFLEHDAERFVVIAGYVAQEELDVPPSPVAGPALTRLETVRDLARRPATCLEKEAFAVLSHEFDLFLDVYQSAYVADHQARRSPAVAAPYVRAAAAPLARFLEDVCLSPLVVAPEPLARAREAIHAARRVVCERLSPFALRTRATCSCGHRLGQDPGLVPIQTVQGWLEESLAAVLRELSAPDKRAALASARVQLTEIGHKREAAVVAEVEAVATRPADLGQRLARLSGSHVAQALSEAAGLEHPVERDLGVLVDQLSGKLLTRAQIMEAVSRWLGPEIRDGSVVRLPHRARSASPGAAPAEPGGDPELSALGSGRGPDDTLRLALLTRWARAHRVPEAAAMRAAGLEPAQPEALDALDGLAVRTLEAAAAGGVAGSGASGGGGGGGGGPASSTGEDAQRVVAALSSGDVLVRLEDLVARDASIDRLLAALDAEPFLWGLSLRWARLALKALAVVSPERLRTLMRESDAPPRGSRPQAPIRPGSARTSSKEGPGAAVPPTPAGSAWSRSAGRTPGRGWVALAHVDSARRLVRTCGQLLATAAAGASRRGRHPTTAQALSERYVASAGIPLALSRMQLLATELGLETELGATGVAAHIQDLLSTHAAEFEAVYKTLLPQAFQPRGGPLFPHRLATTLVPLLRRDLSPPSIHLVVVDAMRWDFFLELEPAIASLARLGLTRRSIEPLWALAPTVTGVNMRALLTGEVPGRDAFLSEPEESTGRCGDATMEPRQGAAASSFTSVRIADLDDALHTSGEALAHLYDALVPRIATRLHAIVEELPRGSLMLLTADHGFVEDPGYRPHGPRPRYRHGGVSPEEVIVPLAVYRKA